MKLALPYNTDKNPGQKRFHASPALAKYYCGALGAGKTSALCVEAYALSVEFPGNVGLLARESLPQLKTTTLQRFLEYIPSDLILEHRKVDRTIYLRTIGDKPSIVYYGPLDDLERYKSLDLGWWACDEANKMTEDMFNILIGRLRHPGVRHSAMLASNPTTTMHWLYKKFFESTDPDFQVFRAKTRDNAHNLPAGYIERLMKAYPEDWQKRYLEGEPGILIEGTAVFPDFREDLHVKPVIYKQGRKLLRGWDFGYHYPMCVFATFDELGRFHVLDMVAGEDEDLPNFAHRVIQKTNIDYPGAQAADYCDIAGIQRKDNAKSSVQTLNDPPFRIYPTYRYVKIEERAVEIRRLMREVIYQEPAFAIHPRCRKGIDSLIGYHYRKNKDGTPTNEPNKDNIHDHFIDAMGYILANTSLVNNQHLPEEQDVDIFEPSYFKKRLGGARGNTWRNAKGRKP